MGYEKHKNTDRYIVAGDKTKQRDTLANNLTNAFGYYRQIAGLDKKVQLKGLRKKYITRMEMSLGIMPTFLLDTKRLELTKSITTMTRNCLKKWLGLGFGDTTAHSPNSRRKQKI